MQRKQSESDTFSQLETDPLSLTLSQIAWLAPAFDTTPAEVAAELLREAAK